MARIIFVLLALLAPHTGAAQERPPLTVVDGTTVTLQDYLWTARPVVIFADTPLDPRYGEQMDLLASDPAALVERDVVVISDTQPAARSAVREALRPRGFMLAVLAKDGTVVLRKPTPWTVREITHAIDKLPLRKDEAAREHHTLTD